MILENADKHIKLAVDLIQLLEENDIEPSVVLQALVVVERDFLKKQQALNSSIN